MEYRGIGSLKVSEVGLGCNNFGRSLGESETKSIVFAALDHGINFFDTADIYGNTDSEVYLGRVLRQERKKVVIGTKFGKPLGLTMRGASPKYIRQAVEASLKRLGTDYIDLYQLHEADPDTPIRETLETLGKLVKEGKVLEIGCSNFSAAQLEESVQEGGETQFVSVQNEYSLLYRGDEEEAIPFCEEHGLAYLPYYPLASGLLTGKYRRDQEIPGDSRLATGWHKDRLTHENLDKVESLIKFAAQSDRSILDLSVSWLLSRRVVASVIAGATRPEQVAANAVSANWKLSADELAEIDRITASV